MPRSPRVSPRAMIPQGEWRTSAAGCTGTYDPRFAVMAVPSHADLMQYYGMSHAQIDTVVPQVRAADAKPTKGERMSDSARVSVCVLTERRACVKGARGMVVNHGGLVSNYGGLVQNNHGQVHNVRGQVQNFEGAVCNTEGNVYNEV